jgi:transposase
MNRVHTLSDREIQELEQLYRDTKNADARTRCAMILLSNEGLSPPKIAQHVRFSHDTVVRFIKRYNREGIAGLHSKPRPGRPRRVTDQYLTQLSEAIEQVPRDLGLPFSNWTAANLAAYLAERTGIVIGARQVENYLKAKGYRLRRPVRTVEHKQDPELVEEKETDPNVYGPIRSLAYSVVRRLCRSEPVANRRRMSGSTCAVA